MRIYPEETGALIDFEEKFSQYLQDYRAQLGIEDDRLEEMMPKIYLDWLDKPAVWLGGKSPNAYFASLDDVKLIELLGHYVLAGIALPGPLIGCIVEKSACTYSLLLSLMKNYDGEKSDALKSAIVRLIEETDLPRPYAYYIEVIAAAGEESSFSEACANELKGAGSDLLDSVLLAYENAKSRYAADCFLDVLADMPFDTRVYEHVLERFLYSEQHKALYASLLGKLGSENALPYLEEAMRRQSLKYYDYLAIKNAYEALGGEIEIERDFSGDEDFEALAKMGD